MRRMIKAVVFDLWETLVDWDRESATNMLQAVAGRSGLEPDEFHRRWDAQDNPRYVGPIRDALRGVGVAEEAIEDVCALRLDYTRRALVPRAGVVETLRALRERGFLVGLITVCSEDVEVVFPETELAGLFDAEVFSNAVRLAKPDPRIYLHCCELLGVEPAGGGLRRRRRQRRARGRAARRHGGDPHPSCRARSRSWPEPAGLGRPARHLDPRGAGRAAGRAPRAEPDASQVTVPGTCPQACTIPPMPRVRRPRRQAPVLELLEATLPELRRGLTESAARTVAYELFEKLGYGAVAVTDTHQVLAFVGAGADHHAAGDRPIRPVYEALAQRRPLLAPLGLRTECEPPRLPARRSRRRAAATERRPGRRDRRLRDRRLAARRDGGRDARGARRRSSPPSCSCPS